MATQTIEFGAPAGQTVTARLFAAGSDTMVATATATARTNATGVYTAAFADLTPGLYRLIGTNAAGTLLCQWWVRTLAATATYPATETPDADSITRDRMGYLDGVLIAANYNQRTVSVTGGPTPHIAASIHNAEPDSIPAGALTTAAIAEIQSNLALQSTLLLVAGYIDTEVSAIKSVTDKLNTGLVADNAVFQFTANMLELAPQASGGGSATIENQQLILDELDTLRNSFAAAVGRLAVASQITGFPAALVRNSDYSTVTESEIRLSLNDLDGNPITEIGGVQCSEIDWLFGLGSERAPAIIEGAATWDDANNQLVIQIAADDTAATALGTLSWQIGCTIDTTTRFLGGGTTRLIERHF